MNTRLTAKQQAFADFYIIHKNATKAARLAGYSGDDNAMAVIGARNLRNAKIRAYIDRAFQEQVMSRDEVLARLASIAGGDGTGWAPFFAKADDADPLMLLGDAADGVYFSLTE